MTGQSEPAHFHRKGKKPFLMEREYVNPDGSRLPVLFFPALEAGGIAQHFFTTRMGGVSEGHCATLNFSSGCGDNPEHIRENFRRAAAAFGTRPERIVTCHQVHGTNVLRAFAEDAGKRLPAPETACGGDMPGGLRNGNSAGAGEGNSRSIPDGADGLVTNEPEVMLGIFTADCGPIVLVDPVRRAVGACHSGWRGTAGRIAGKTVFAMQREFGTDPHDLLAGIGPSICQEHYEVSEEVAGVFREEFPGLDAQILRYAGHPGHAQLNLWEACRITLREAGVPEQQIYVTDICTACNPELLFSHRASHGKRGNLGTFVMLSASCQVIPGAEQFPG